MFGDRDTAGSDDDGRDGGNIERAEAVSACPAGVDQRLAMRHLDMRAAKSHHAHGGCDLLRCFTFHAEGYSERGDLLWRCLPAEDRLHRALHERRVEVLPLDGFADRFLKAHAASLRFSPESQFRSMAWPCSVRNDSG